MQTGGGGNGIEKFLSSGTEVPEKKPAEAANRMHDEDMPNDFSPATTTKVRKLKVKEGTFSFTRSGDRGEISRQVQRMSEAEWLRERGREDSPGQRVQRSNNSRGEPKPKTMPRDHLRKRNRGKGRKEREPTKKKTS